MKIKYNVSSIDKQSTDNTRNMIKRIDMLENSAIYVGFFSGSVYPDGTPVASVAKWNNDGTDTIPERPFFTKGILIGRLQADQLSKELVPKYLNGKIPFRTYQNAIGETYQNAIVDMIDSNIQPPNAYSTLKRKLKKGGKNKKYSSGSPKTLIDSGTMRKAVSYRTER